MKTIAGDISSAAGGLQIACPKGRRIRVLSILASITGVGFPECISHRLICQGNIIYDVAGQVSFATVQTFSCLGGTVTQMVIANFDPVTGTTQGVLSTPIVCLGALPDMWFDTDITVMGIDTGGASVTTGLVVYEES